MSKELQISQGDWSNHQIELLKNTLCKGISDGEFQIFLHACKRTGLDPFMRQIYAVKRKTNENGIWKEAMILQVGIDGYRLVAERSGGYCPGREPTFAYDKDGKVFSATAYVKKQTKDGTWHEVPATAFFSEYIQRKAGRDGQKGDPTKFWLDMPHSQLAKCAEALALRKAFPAELSGIYTAEEMQQADNVTLNAQVEEIPHLTQEEIDGFYTNFNGDIEASKAYVAMCMSKKKWSESQTIVELQKDVEASHKAYAKWAAKNRPVEVVIEPKQDDEPPSVFAEVK